MSRGVLSRGVLSRGVLSRVCLLRLPGYLVSALGEPAAHVCVLLVTVGASAREATVVQTVLRRFRRESKRDPRRGLLLDFRPFRRGFGGWAGHVCDVSLVRGYSPKRVSAGGVSHNSRAVQLVSCAGGLWGPRSVRRLRTLSGSHGTGDSPRFLTVCIVPSAFAFRASHRLPSGSDALGLSVTCTVSARPAGASVWPDLPVLLFRARPGMPFR
jgi:hypothetical protein